MKYTQGKWNVKEARENLNGLSSFVSYQVVNDDEVVIAKETTEANANLIAAVPEMLTFLKEIVHNDKRWRAMNPKNNQGRYDIKLIDKVNYLIRKAEGGK